MMNRLGMYRNGEWMNDEYMYMLGYYGNGEWMDYE